MIKTLKSVPSCDPGFDIQQSHLEHCLLEHDWSDCSCDSRPGREQLHSLLQGSRGWGAAVGSSSGCAPWMLLDFIVHADLGYYAVKHTCWPVFCQGHNFSYQNSFVLKRDVMINVQRC